MSYIELTWGGPYSWPGYENESKLPPIPKSSGVYLQTFRYKSGYLIYAAGLTRRPVPMRFKEHTRNYMNGDYTVLDNDMAENGHRKEIWRGWGYAREHREEFEEHKSMILDAVNKQLTGFNIFVAELANEERTHERLEASIMNNLYRQISPISEIPDKGMQLSGRMDSETPTIVKNNCSVVIHGLPDLLEI
jgi:hypothetical protein